MYRIRGQHVDSLGRLFFCFEIAVVITLSGQFSETSVGAMGDRELLESSEGESHAMTAAVKEAECSSGRQAAWAGSMAG